MIIHPCEQGTTAWYQLRAGVPTASEFCNLLTSQFKIRTGEMPKTYLATKLAEMWVGGPLPGFTSWATDQGKIRETEAIPWYALETGQDVEKVGFISTDDMRFGCSPDGLLGKECGIEIKCPEPTQHVKFLLAGDLPDEYRAQVHGSMFVTGMDKWKFLSYRRGFPPLLLTIERDEEIAEKIADALSGFMASFEKGMAALVKANGSPPPKKKLYQEATWISEPLKPA